ncbi:MAG: hypothetical protein U5K51_10755 [Flavobacteriaceae bacterium]|nr:hypothetical protein [Flavobacteriaceae bacterium]
MDSEHNYAEINKQSWNNRTDIHIKSEFYDVPGFLKGNTSLNDIELGPAGRYQKENLFSICSVISGRTVFH